MWQCTLSPGSLIKEPEGYRRREVFGGLPDCQHQPGDNLLSQAALSSDSLRNTLLSSDSLRNTLRFMSGFGWAAFSLRSEVSLTSPRQFQYFWPQNFIMSVGCTGIPNPPSPSPGRKLAIACTCSVLTATLGYFGVQTPRAPLVALFEFCTTHWSVCLLLAYVTKIMRTVST